MEAEKIHTNVSDIWIDADNILRVHVHEGAHLTLQDMKDGFEIYSRLGFGPGKKKTLQLLTGAKFFTLSKEAREYGGKHGNNFFIAAAVVSDSAALRFLVNVFNRLNNPDVPFKVFSNANEALEWLKGFK